MYLPFLLLRRFPPPSHDAHTMSDPIPPLFFSSQAWLRKGSALASKQQAAAVAAVAAQAATPGMAFVPSLSSRGTMDVYQRSANDREKHRWMSLDEIGSNPRLAAAAAAARSSRLPARARRSGCGCGSGGGRSAGARNPSMLLGRFRRGGFPLRRGSGKTESKVDGSNGASTDGADREGQMTAAQAQAEATSRNAAAVAAISEALEDPERAPPSSMLSSFFGGAADAYDNALSFVGSTLIRSPIGKKYMNGYDSGPTSIRRSGGEPADMSTGSTYDLVGFSNIDPFEASARRVGGTWNRL